MCTYTNKTNKEKRKKEEEEKINKIIAFGNAKQTNNKTKAFLNASKQQLKQKTSHKPNTTNKTKAFINAPTQAHKHEHQQKYQQQKPIQPNKTK